MVTLSADVTPLMKKWVAQQVKKGTYKSGGEVVREALRELMENENLEKADYKNWFLDREDSRAREQIKYLEEKGLL